mgnify:CR=1 FL=1
MAKGATFNTIPTDLIEHAEVAYKRFDELGYTVSVEPTGLGYPKTPAMSCRRQHTTMIVEVCKHIDMRALRSWAALCRSTSHDLRIAICMPAVGVAKELHKYQLECNELGIGIYVSDGRNLQELGAPQDLSVQVHLPELKGFPKHVRKALGSAYEQFGRKQWREGFEEACKAFEQRARIYLRDSIVSNRLTVYEKGIPKNPSRDRIDKMTLGQLADTFAKAQPQNATDSLLHKTLSSINPDRVGVAHKLDLIKTEKSLRKNVGVHMHSIIQALHKLKK